MSKDNKNNNSNNNKENVQPEMTDESAKSPSFFQSNNLSNKRTDRKYTTTCTKSRNFLSNIYVGINKEDFYNQNFIFAIYLMMTKNLNPFLLDRKLNYPNKHEMVYMMWKECMPTQFYRFICKEENFLYLNGKNVLQPKVSEILTNVLEENKNNYVLLRSNLSQYKNIFQYAYSNVFPAIYCGTERRGFDLKSTFHIVFKADKDKKN